MKIAIAFDYLVTKGGMERTIIVLAKAFKADIWTTSYDEGSTFPEFRKLRVFPSPLLFGKQGLMQTEAVFRFRRMNLSEYDLVISMGDWAKQISMKPRNHPHLHYDTPVRAFYDLYENIKARLPVLQRQIFKGWVWIMKKIDLQAAQKIDVIVSPSQTVRERIRKYYKRDAEVVWAPVNIKKFAHKGAEDYFLSVQRIGTTKGIELQLEVFRKLPKEKLIIVGSVTKQTESYLKKLKEMAPKNVTFKESVSDEELLELYSRCKAVIQTSVDEDLGKVPIEAMASGKPCIAIKEGGFRETIIHGRTGILCEPPYLESLIKAIKSFDESKWNPSVCRKRAEFFSEENFVKRVKRVVSNMLNLSEKS